MVELKVSVETSLHDSMNRVHWNELVDDLWSDALPHLRDQGSTRVWITVHSTRNAYD